MYDGNLGKNPRDVGEKQNYDAKCVQADKAQVQSSTRSYTLAEEAEKNLRHHAEAHGKSLAAYEFLSKHPEFDVFVKLIRSGSIQI